MAYRKYTTNLPTRIEFNGVQVGKGTDNDVQVVSLNVDGLDGGMSEEPLAYMDTRASETPDDLVLQDTRCTQVQAHYNWEQLRKRLGRRCKLFNLEGVAALIVNGEERAVRDGGHESARGERCVCRHC